VRVPPHSTAALRLKYSRLPRMIDRSMARDDDAESNGWSIADARRRFSDVIAAAVREPQQLCSNGRIVAAVIGGDELCEWRAGRAGRTLAEAFDELRAICRQERYDLRLRARSDRRNPFALSR